MFFSKLAGVLNNIKGDTHAVDAPKCPNKEGKEGFVPFNLITAYLVNALSRGPSGKIYKCDDAVSLQKLLNTTFPPIPSTGNKRARLFSPGLIAHIQSCVVHSPIYSAGDDKVFSAYIRKYNAAQLASLIDAFDYTRSESAFVDSVRKLLMRYNEAAGTSVPLARKSFNIDAV